MEIFEYDKQATYDDNFHRWYLMNSSERRMYNEETLTKEEAELTFKRLYGGEELKSYAATILSKAFS